MKENYSKENYLILVLMMITVPLAGELKFYPFHDTFRVSFGIPIFFFFLLWTRKIPTMLSGLLVGVCVVMFRIALGRSTNSSFLFIPALRLHFSALLYYVTYSILFNLTRINDYHDQPLIIGFISVFIEITSSMVELAVRHSALGDAVTLSILIEVILIAIVRSFFALSFFTIIKLRQAKISSEQQQIQNSHMLLLISSLYEESIQLKKSLQYAENITRDCYNLYQKLLNSGSSYKTDELAQKILGVAGQVHEIKKDNQRIYAGLVKMISSENSTDFMPVEDLGNIIIQTNQKYAESLGKDIVFKSDIDDGIPPLHAYTVLSLVNNLVSNSVESIDNTGLIDISIYRKDEQVIFKVLDNGAGIPEKKRELIFKPGYTTKYDEHGKPSTGMGLPYIKEVVANLRGIISVHCEYKTNNTVFIIQLPIYGLIQKG